MRQAISKSRLLKILGIILLFVVAWNRGEATGRIPFDGSIDELVAQLSSPQWSERERATAELIERGNEAAATLRALETHEDPEVRTRARYILDLIDPWVYDVRVYRLIPDAADARVTGFTDLRIVAESESQSVQIRHLDASKREVVDTLIVKAIGESSPFTISIAFGMDQNSPTERRPLQAESVSILRQVDHLEALVMSDGVERSVSTVMWIVECRGVARMTSQTSASATPAVGPEEAENQLYASLETAIDSEVEAVSTQAVRIVGWLNSSRTGPTPGPKASPLNARTAELATDATGPLRLQCQLAAMRAGDPKSTSAVEAWLESRAEPGEEQIRDEASISLTERGSTVGLTELLARVGSMSSWLQYRAMQAIIDRWDGSGFTEPEARQIFHAFTSPQVFGFLPWYTDGIVRTLFRRMIDAVPIEDSRPMILESLANTNPTASGGVFRVRALLAAVGRLRTSGKIEVREWLAPVLESVTNAAVTKEALRLVLAAIVAGELNDESWVTLLGQFEEAFAGEDQALMRNLDSSIDSMLAAPEISAANKRSLWSLRIGRLIQLEGNLSHLRRQVDVKLVKAFGLLDQAAPRPKESPAWAARAELWTARLAEADDAVFDPVPGADQYPFVELELELTPGQPAKILRFDRYELRPGLPIARREPGNAPSTLQLDAYASSAISRRQTGYAERFLLSGGTIYMNLPTIRASIRGHRSYRFTLAEGDYRPRAVPGSTTNQFRTLTWLRPVDAPPLESWDDVVRALVAGCSDELAQRSNGCRQVIADAGVVEALPALQALYEASPSSELAITLLQLGDLRGRAELLDGLESKTPRDALAVLTALAANKDEEAVDLLLSWVAKPPARLRTQTYGLLRILEEFARDHPHLVETRKWVDILIPVLDQRNGRDYGTRILRRITGKDFGYARRYQEYPDAAKRTAAEIEIIESWRQWYGRYVDHQPKSPRD